MKTIFHLILLLQIITVASYAQRAVFMYESAGYAGKSGAFSFYDTNDKQLFSAKASAGYKNDANSPYSQGLKDKGPIPGGTWYISGIKNHKLSVLILEPGRDVHVGDRNGFLIHGFASGSTPEESSRGCIIIGPAERKIIRDIFISNGKKKIPISVLAVDSSSGN
ncbi:DUF2778 domain-containing protein [Fulvivirgaceae bacterium BMA12]|uniref:DUF2778 domain-containing protein n=1 Tax=Agaribacillus aureus TaxID=3051825 RepID=A0ABT8LFF8_9BACT|nr:DUF2778 domain-containing protein [Fulvivirgaceae bacterium BMA12]